MASLPAPDVTTLQNLVEGMHRSLDAPRAFSPGDPDKNRVRELQAIAGHLMRSDLANEKARALQLLEQAKLLIDGIDGIGTRVSLKPVERMVAQAVVLLRKHTSP